ncbi:TPA: hypothetical protein ACPY50_000539 [Yersinia enterocolitica]
MTNDKTHQIDAPTFSVSQQPTELPLSALLTQRCVEFSNSPKAVEIIDKGIESRAAYQRREHHRAGTL